MTLCAWCQEKPLTDPRALFCGRKCRQAAFRFRRRRTTEARDAKPLRLCYADPPYPGLSSKYYRDEPSFAGEVDHRALIAALSQPGAYDGWALSTSAKALRDILPLCPPEARVCAWVKPIGACPNTFGLHNTWEPLIVVPARALRPGVRDWLSAQPARFGGELPGRKPQAFVAFMLDAMGALPGDSLDDLFPGTGIVGRLWAYLSSRVVGGRFQAALGDGSAAGVSYVSIGYRDDASAAADDGSPGDGDDASQEYSSDVSPRVQGDAPGLSDTTAPRDTFGAAPSDVFARAHDDALPRGVGDGSRFSWASQRVLDDGCVAQDLRDGGTP